MRKARVSVMGAKGKLPAEYTPEERREVCREVFAKMAEGVWVGHTATALGLRVGTVRLWIAQEPKMFAEYQRLKAVLGQAFAEEALQVARTSTVGSFQRDRLLVDTLKWSAAKANPLEFGDKQVVEHSGGQELRIKVVEENILTRREGLEENTGDKQARKKKKVTAVARIDRHAPDDMPG